MRKKLAFAGFFLWIAACSQTSTTPGPTADLYGAADLALLGDLGDRDMTDVPGDLRGCGFQFGTTSATDTASGDPVALRGGSTDHASVVTIEVKFPGVQSEVLTVRYQSGIANCAQATFSKSELMMTGGTSPGSIYTAYLPAVAAGTHVCWKVSAAACGGTITDPPAGMVSYDYTTY